jgi:hypothetical protein
VEEQNNKWEAEKASSLEEARTFLNRWRRRAIVLGIALFASVASVVPFLEGHSLHAHSYSIGRPLLLFSGCLLTAFLFCAGQTYNFWVYLRDLKKAFRNDSADS